jgi:hypothetical protein
MAFRDPIDISTSRCDVIQTQHFTASSASAAMHENVSTHAAMAMVTFGAN